MAAERAIRAAVPAAKINGFVGGSGHFEVNVNGYMAHSKARSGAFPDYAKLAAEIAAFASSGAVPVHWTKA